MISDLFRLESLFLSFPPALRCSWLRFSPRTNGPITHNDGRHFPGRKDAAITSFTDKHRLNTAGRRLH
jgi:hypothetical protein